MLGLELLTEVSLFCLSYSLLGYSILLVFISGQKTYSTLFFSFILGQVVFYLYCILGFPLHLSKLVPILTLPLWGLKYFFHKKLNLVARSLSIMDAVGILFFSLAFLYFALPYIEGIIKDPIYQWDARCGWYYHAKQIYLADGINDATGLGLKNAFNVISHPYYPKYTNCVSAYFASSLGYWNEYIPKCNLYVHLFGVFLGLLCLTKIHLLLRISFSYFIFSYNSFWLTSGYMDIWLGIYFGISALYLIQYFTSNNRVDLLVFLSTLFFLMHMKREGMMIDISVFIGIGVCSLLFFNKRSFFYAIGVLKNNLVLLCLVVAPYFVWSFKKTQLGIVLPTQDFDFKRVLDIDFTLEQLRSWRFEYVYNSFVIGFRIYHVLIILILIAGISVLAMYLGKVSSVKIKRYLFVWLTFVTAFFFFMTFLILSYVVAMVFPDMKFYVDSSAGRIYSTFFMFLVVAFMSINLSFFNKHLFNRYSVVNLKKKK